MLENIFFIFFIFFLFAIKQNPTPQLNVLSISASLILFFFNHLKIDLEKIVHVEHDSCHAAYALYGSPIREDGTLIFTADAFGDDLSGTISRYNTKDNKIERLRSYSHKDFQLARIYRLTTLFLRMSPNEHEYKVMGLASYYTGSKREEVEKIFDKILTLDGIEFNFNKI